MPGYLIHFNKNHDRLGRFSAGDGDGDAIRDDHHHYSQNKSDLASFGRDRRNGRSRDPLGRSRDASNERKARGVGHRRTDIRPRPGMSDDKRQQWKVSNNLSYMINPSQFKYTSGRDKNAVISGLYGMADKRNSAGWILDKNQKKHTSKDTVGSKGYTENSKNLNIDTARNLRYSQNSRVGSGYGKVDEEGRNWSQRQKEKDPDAESLSEISGNEDDFYYLDEKSNTGSDKARDLVSKRNMDKVTEKFKDVDETVLDFIGKFVNHKA